MPRQDKQQKDRDDERDEDERDEDEREEEDEDEADDASDDDDESDESDDDDDDEGEPDAAAQRVAKALGVAEEDEKEAATDGVEGESEDKPEEEADAAKPNRAARRREEALARRKKRAAAEASGSNEDDSSSSDKNTRAKDLLKRRREQAASAARTAPVASSLDAGEMVDDALARSAAAIGKWFKSNVHVIQWIVLIGLVGAGGYVMYNMRTEKNAGEASTKLIAGIAADRGIVLDEDKRSEDEKEYDSRRVFKTTGERADSALGSFTSVVEQHRGSGAALLAKLGQGGAYLEKKEYDKAIASYGEVLSSPLAAADPDVKGRATEGTGFAKEGKGDLDGALTSFKELGAIDVKGYKELATYHEARMLFAKGDKAKAKELLEPLNTKLMTPSTEPQPLGYLKSAVGDLFTQVDPSAAAAAANKPAPGKMPSQAEIQDMARRAQESLQQKAPPQNGTP